MIEIICTNNRQKKLYPMGTSLLQIAGDMHIETGRPLLAALVNNEVKSLHYRIYKNKVVRFIDATDSSGYLIYERSLLFMLYRACKDVYPSENLTIKHAVPGGKYCTFDNPDFHVTEQTAAAIERRMRELVAEDLPFEHKEIPTPEALQLYEASGLSFKKGLIEDRNYLYTSVYYLGDCINYFYGNLAPSTRCITTFQLEAYESGLLLAMPSQAEPEKLLEHKPSPKLFSIFKEYKEWSRILNISYVNDINHIINNGMGNMLLLLAEALQEKKVAKIADRIAERGNVKVVLLSGPSSSGKTTTAKRISMQLGVLGYHPVPISMDNYFVDRDQTPIDENGQHDFEHLNAIDLPLFNEQVEDLIQGKEIETPTFDFQQGCKLWKGKKLKLYPQSVLVIEGIHALNPALLTSIAKDQCFRIYTSALTTTAIDPHNPIHSTDNRLIRRIIRDARYRNYSAENSLLRWDSVRRGEARWIFPFQENADEMFNSAICCELNIFKPFALQLLYKVTEASEAYTDARRLIKMLEYFTELPEKDVPLSSILREFFGGSVFKY